MPDLWVGGADNGKQGVAFERMLCFYFLILALLPPRIRKPDVLGVARNTHA